MPEAVFGHSHLQPANSASWRYYPLYAFVILTVGPSLFAPLLYLAYGRFGITEVLGGQLSVQYDMIFFSPIILSIANVPFLVLYRICSKAIVRESPSIRSVRIAMWCSITPMFVLGVWFLYGVAEVLIANTSGVGVGWLGVLLLQPISFAILGPIGWFMGRGIAWLTSKKRAR